jgi:hypothetical protein
MNYLNELTPSAISKMRSNAIRPPQQTTKQTNNSGLKKTPPRTLLNPRNGHLKVQQLSGKATCQVLPTNG